MMYISIFLYVSTIILQVFAHREHKVHNIVLYPDKQSWCKTTPIKQVVTSPGYKSTTIDNNVCVGACFSYSIPKTQPAEPGELIVPYCDSCQPVATRCYHVTLTAEETNDDEEVRTLQKRVQIITNCTCLSCGKTSSTDCEMSDENTSELPENLFSDRNPDSTLSGENSDESSSNQQPPDEIPELLNFTPNKTRPDTHNLHLSEIKTKEQKYEINGKLIALLRSIQDQEDDSPNFNYDKGQLKELLRIIEGSEAKLSDKNLMEFVNFVNIYNSEDLELDLSRLKEVLTNFEKEQQEIIERHKNFGLGEEKHGHSSTSTIDLDEANTELSSENIQNHNSLEGNTELKHFNKKHYIGEHMGVGHLIMGPHHSFVIQEDHPKGVEEKLNVAPHLLKPNHAGTVLSYENHKNV